MSLLPGFFGLFCFFEIEFCRDLNSPYSWGWMPPHSNSPASASRILGLQECATQHMASEVSLLEKARGQANLKKNAEPLGRRADMGLRPSPTPSNALLSTSAHRRYCCWGPPPWPAWPSTFFSCSSIPSGYAAGGGRQMNTWKPTVAAPPGASSLPHWSAGEQERANPSL